MDTSTVELPPHEEESALDDALLCFDNPLLDIRVCVNEDFLRQKNLGKNDMVIAQAEHMPMFREILTDPIFENSRSLLPGGSGLNTARAAAWCCRRLLSDFDGASSKRVAFVGTIAQDANGKLLKEISEADGVTFHATYPSHSTQPQCSHQDEEEAKIATTLNATSHASHEVPWTGACAVLVSGHHRSLVTHLGASAFFDSSSLVQNLEIQQEVQRSSLLYVTGFFLRTTPETCTMLAQLSQEHAVPSRNGGTGVKRVALNLSAPFIVKSYTNLVISFLEHTTFLFGNREEFMTLCHAANWFSSEEEGELVDIEVVLRKTLSFMAASSTAAGSNAMLRNGNHIIMTNGEHEVIVCRGWKDCVREAKILRHAIKSLPLSALVDTNGAGDAFVGGYLATYLMLGDGCYSGDAVEQIAVECAMYMSAICVCSPGSILPVNSVQPPGSPMIIQSTGQFKEQIARLIRDDRELQ